MLPNKNQIRRNRRIVKRFSATYGKDDTDLQMWQHFCRDVNVEEGSSITKCKKNLKQIYVAIDEFVAAFEEERPPHVFHSYKALQRHLTNTPGARFPVSLAKESPILKWMLVQV